MVIHGNKLRWLFWLRWTLFLRRSIQGPGRVARVAGIIAMAVIFLSFGVTGAITVYIFFRFLPSSVSAEILFLLLTGIYLGWVFLPLIGFNTNEGLDVSKLSLFPLTRLELMLSLVISTLLDIPTTVLFLILVAVIASWGTSILLALFATITMLLFYIQIIGASQLVLALLMRLLQSRRFRDISIVLTVLLSFSGYLCQFAFRGFKGENFLEALKYAPFSPYLQWVPPGMAARAIQQTSIGHWGMGFSWLGGLLVADFVVLYLWQLVVERGLTTSESGGTLRIGRRKAKQSVAATTPEARLPMVGTQKRIFPAQASAIMLKDVKYLWRDPQLNANFIRSLLYIFLPLVLLSINTQGSNVFAHWSVMLVPFLLSFSLFGFSYNILGAERQSLTTLFLFPVDPKHILWGKNMMVLLIGVVEITFVLVVAAFLSQGWELVLPAFIISIAGLGVIVGCGNVTSVFFPIRVQFTRQGFQSTANTSVEGGCLRTCMSLGTLFAELVLLLPVLAALLLPFYFNTRWIWLLTVPASLVYSAVLYYTVTNWVASRLLARTPEILAIVARE